MSDAVEIIRLRDVDARFEQLRWDFAEERKADIAANWTKVSAGKNGMFDGVVLLQHRWRIEDGVYETRYSPVRYSSFVAWPAFGKPGPARRNGFAMAALRAADGAFVLGVMGPHTFNAGKIYFPAGTPDMEDVTPDGRVDLSGSLLRELMEETGLREHEVEVAPDWTLAIDGHRAAFLKRAELPWPAAEARRIILDRMAAESDQELSDIAIVRQPSDIDEAMTPDFAKSYMRWAFAAD